jgi:hypothetical protein
LLREEVDGKREHDQRHDDDEESQEIAENPPPIPRARRPDRAVYQALAVTIAIGHEWIVTFICMTTERTEGTDSGPGAKRDALRRDLLDQHRAARARREAAALGSDEFRAAAEEIARIEVALNRLEEPDAGLSG